MSKQTANRILLFTGDGKGKTTAALGIVLRCVGHGMDTALLQFMKSRTETGELRALTRFDSVDLHVCGLGFLRGASGEALAKHRAAAEQGLARARRLLSSGDYACVVLDEVCGAIAKGLLDENEVVEAVRQASPGTIVVMTGRNAGPGLIDLADTVTEMSLVKHGIKLGIKAQDGVER